MRASRRSSLASATASRSFCRFSRVGSAASFAAPWACSRADFALAAAPRRSVRSLSLGFLISSSARSFLGPDLHDFPTVVYSPQALGSNSGKPPKWCNPRLGRSRLSRGSPTWSREPRRSPCTPRSGGDGFIRSAVASISRAAGSGVPAPRRPHCYRGTEDRCRRGCGPCPRQGSLPAQRR